MYQLSSRQKTYIKESLYSSNDITTLLDKLKDIPQERQRQTGLGPHRDPFPLRPNQGHKELFIASINFLLTDITISEEKLLLVLNLLYYIIPENIFP